VEELLPSENSTAVNNNNNNNNYTLRNIPEERRSHLQRGGSLKSRTFCENFLYRFYGNWNTNIETTDNILSIDTAFTTSVFTKMTNAQRHYADLYTLNVTQIGEEIRTLHTDIYLRL